MRHRPPRRNLGRPISNALAAAGWYAGARHPTQPCAARSGEGASGGPGGNRTRVRNVDTALQHANSDANDGRSEFRCSTRVAKVAALRASRPRQPMQSAVPVTVLRYRWRFGSRTRWLDPATLQASAYSNPRPQPDHRSRHPPLGGKNEKAMRQSGGAVRTGSAAAATPSDQRSAPNGGL